MMEHTVMADYKEATTHTHTQTHAPGYSCVITDVFSFAHFHKRVQMGVRCGQNVMLCVSVSASVITHQHTPILQSFFQVQSCGCLPPVCVCVCYFFFYLNQVYLLVFDVLPLEGNVTTAMEGGTQGSDPPSVP